MRWVLIVFAVIVLGGCSSEGGRVTAESQTIETDNPVEVVKPDGTVIKTTGPTTIKAKSATSEQPQNPQDAGTVAITDTGVSASTGSSHGSDQALGQLWWMPVAGAVLLVGGLLAFVLRAKYPFLPKFTGPAMAAGGVILIGAPMFLDRYMWIVACVFVAGIGILILFVLRKMGIIQRGFDGTLRGVQDFKARYPQAKGVLNEALHKSQRKNGRAAVRVVEERKDQL